MAIAVMTIEAAREALALEREKLRAEAEAFGAFERRVASLRPSSADRLVGTARPIAAAPDRSQIARLRALYAETVMGVEHYEEDYGEDLLANVVAELGADRGELLRADTAVTSQLKRSFQAAAEAARQRRERFLAVLDEEAAALDRAAAFLEAERPLPAVPDDQDDISFDRLVDRHAETAAVESRAQPILASRQEQLHDRGPRVIRSDDVASTTLCEYLYASIDETYPVLAAMTAFLSETRSVRRALGRSIAHHRG